MDELVKRIRQYHAEITEVDGGESGEMAMFREAADRIEALERALLDATANLAGAASAYRKYARRGRHLGRVDPDPFFTTRASDFDKAVERARAALEGK